MLKGRTSWSFQEPFEAAIFARRRASAPVTARRASPRARSNQVFDFWLEEPWPTQRRARAPTTVVHTPAAPVAPARRLLAMLLASGVYDTAQTSQGRPQHMTPSARAGDDAGRSASFTVTFTGKGDDPYGGVGMAIASGVALGVDPGRELAVQNLAVFGGSSASRAV